MSTNERKLSDDRRQQGEKTHRLAGCPELTLWVSEWLEGNIGIYSSAIRILVRAIEKLYAYL
jgi:hypothetical protein